MNSETSEFTSLIPMWLAATKDVELPTPPIPEELEHRVSNLRALLREGNTEAVHVEPDSEGLAVLSRLCFELSNPSTGSAELLFREASTAYDIVSRMSLPCDEFGERNEILSYMALAAWRSARRVCSSRVVQEWERKHQEAVLGSVAVRMCLEGYLAMASGGPPQDLKHTLFADDNMLFAMVAFLRAQRNVYPRRVAECASDLLDWGALSWRTGEGDEATYLRADLSLIAGGCHRLVGNLREARNRISRAEGLFRTTSRSEAGQARCTYARLALAYEGLRNEEVLSRVANLWAAFTALEMEEEAALCRFLEAAASEALGRFANAIEILSTLRVLLQDGRNPILLGLATSKLADVMASVGRFGEAFSFFKAASSWLPHMPPWARATLKAEVGAALRETGHLTSAITALREAVRELALVRLAPREAYTRLVLAEVLLLANRPREAENEILTALPTIEEQGMVREGVAALALLRESVSRCNIDGKALEQVRGDLKRGLRWEC